MSPQRSGTTSTDDFARRRERMVQRQLRSRGIDDERVLRAMAEVPREAFLPEEVRDDAYRDGAVPIGEGQTMSQPWIVACMTMLIEPRGEELVLEVGTGSGYGAAVLSRCCREVVTIERHEPLAARAAATLAALGYSNVEVRAGDGCAGAPDRAPFDAVLIAAAAEREPPRALRAQLRAEGTLVCPVRDHDGEHLTRFRGDAAETVVPVRFVPLVAPDASA
jgi:protein-L-isoaspartate(D-aspartate) O-methyltransferase